AAGWLRLVGLRRGRSATRGCRRVAGIGGVWRRCGWWCHRRDGGCVTTVTLSHECIVLSCGNAVTGGLLVGELPLVSPRGPCSLGWGVTPSHRHREGKGGPGRPNRRATTHRKGQHHHGIHDGSYVR